VFETGYSGGIRFSITSSGGCLFRDYFLGWGQNDMNPFIFQEGDPLLLPEFFLELFGATRSLFSGLVGGLYLAPLIDNGYIFVLFIRKGGSPAAVPE
jgi:hypothetical protein